MYEKITLNEIAASAEALKTARSEPIQQVESRPRMDFIRSLISDLPFQPPIETPVPILEEPTVIEDNSLDEILRLSGLKQNKV